MTWKTQGRSSATLPQGVTFPRVRECLNALKVVCHGWKSPPRLPCVGIFTPIGRWPQ